jgi:hypothetical protein
MKNTRITRINRLNRQEMRRQGIVNQLSAAVRVVYRCKHTFPSHSSTNRYSIPSRTKELQFTIFDDKIYPRLKTKQIAIEGSKQKAEKQVQGLL